MSTLYAALLALAAPLAAAVFGAITPIRKHGGAAAALTITGTLAALGGAILLVVRTMNGDAPFTHTVRWLPVGGETLAIAGVHVDGTSASMLLVVAIVALAVQVFSIGYMHDDPPASRGRYFLYHALFLFSMNTLVLAPDLMQLFLGWELVGATSYLLIGYFWRKPSAGRAALKAFLVTKLADMGFLVGLLVLYASTGAFAWTASLPLGTAELVAALLFFAVVGKSAQFPLHVWLPDAMEGPTPVSALLHAATMVAAGVYLIVRADPLFAQADVTRDVMTVIGAITALFAASLALVQTDIKKVLAYSTCSQLGYMVCALGAGDRFGGFFHLSTHAFFKALLFLAAGSVIHAVHSNELSDMGGLRKKMPITTVTFAIGALSLAGLPGLAGFFSKDLVLASVEGRLAWIPYVALMLTAFMTALYMGRVLLRAFFGEPSRKAEHAHESGVSMTGPLIVLAIPSLLAGYAGAQLAGVTGAHYELHVGATPILASLLGLAGLGLAYVLHRRGGEEPAVIATIARIAKTSAVNRAYEAAFHHGFTPTSRALGWVDRYLVDGVINAIGERTLRAGAVLRRVQTGDAQDYLFAVVAGVIALIAIGWAI